MADPKRAKRWVPLAVLAVGLVGVGLMVATRPGVEAEPPETAAPLVRVVTAEPRTHRFSVRAFGTVVPRTESELVPQVSGEVLWVSPSLVSGGFFREGDELLRVDASDYDVEHESALAAVARARSEFARAEKERARQRELGGRSVASEARIDDAENSFRVAQAQLREAEARLVRASRDLERTTLRAPFTGRVRSESVDVGQFVQRGASVGTLYAVDHAEVRLPLPDRELQYLDLPLRFGAVTEGPVADGTAPGDAGPPVRLTAEFAGEERAWEGHVVRTEGEIDPRSRMVHVVARVEDPYGVRDPEAVPAEAPLAVGLFVEAEILGRRVERAFVLPRQALRVDPRGENPSVLVVEDGARLRVRPVELLREERDAVVIGGGLEAGERVCVSPLPAPVDGMAVRVEGDPAPAPDAPGAAPAGDVARARP